MAVMSSRSATLQAVVNSIAAQSRPPDELHLYYSRTRWHIDHGWPEPPRVRSRMPVVLHEVPNVGSARKYLSIIAALAAEDACVVLFDDDRAFAPYVLETLHDYVRMTDNVATTRGWTDHTLIKNRYGEMVVKNAAIEAAEVEYPAEVLIPNSGWATMFHVRHVDARLFDSAMRRAYGVRYSDEVFLAAMLRRRKFVVPLPAMFYEDVGRYRGQWLNRKTSQAKLKQLELLRNDQ
jgi:hypothetical protein